MKKFLAQIKNKILIPCSDHDRKQLDSFYENQVVEVSVKGSKKPRSAQQLRLYFACCRTVADNTDDENWNTVEKVHESVKLAIRYVDFYLVTKSGVHAKTKSFSFDKIDHPEFTEKMNEGLQVMADKIGLTVDELTRESAI